MHALGSYLINLDRSTDRLAYMDSQFKRLGIPYERVSAVDGRSLDGKKLTAAFQTMSSGEAGCFYSHRRVWDIVGRCDDTHAAVFEDDIHLSPALPAFLSDHSWIPSNAELIKLETMLMSVDVDKNPSVTHRARSLRRLRSPHWGSAGYIISVQFARSLIERDVQPLQRLDDFLFDNEYGPAQETVIYQVDPALCIQDKVLSVARGWDVSFFSLIDADMHSKRTSERPPKSMLDRLATETRSVVRLFVRHVGSQRNQILRKKIPYDSSA